MGRDKGNRSKTKPSSSAEASDLLYYSGRPNSLSSSTPSSSSYTGLLGSMSAVMGQDAALSGELQIIFKKLYKPSVVTKLKALDELCAILSASSGSSAIFDIDDETSVGALLETFGQLYPRLSTDPERGIRERSSNVLSVLLAPPEHAAARRCLGRHIKAVLPAWLCAMNDPAKEVAARAKAAFSVLPPAGQAKAVAFAQADVAAFLKEALTRSLAGLVPLGHPQTRDDKTAVQEQIDRTFPMYLGALGTVVRTLLNSSSSSSLSLSSSSSSMPLSTTITSSSSSLSVSMPSVPSTTTASIKTDKKTVAAAAAFVQTVFPAVATWNAYFGNKNPAARKAVYKLVADLVEATGGSGAQMLLGVLGMDAGDVAPMTKLVLVHALGEKEPGAQGAMWGCVLAWLCCVGDAAWGAVAQDLRKSVLPRLWALLRAACNGAPEASYPCLLVLLSLVPERLRTEGAAEIAGGDSSAYSFYGSFFGAFWEGLVHCALDSAPGPAGAAPVAAAKGLCECLRFALLRDAQQCPRLEAWLLADVLEPLLLAALCDTRFRAHARPLAAEAAEAAARVLEVRAGTPAAATLWTVLTDALCYALGGGNTNDKKYPRTVPRGIDLTSGTPCPADAAEVVLKRVAQVHAAERDALLGVVLKSAIAAARTGAGSLAFVEETVLPLCPHSVLPDLRADLLPWLQQQQCDNNNTKTLANGIARLCVAAVRSEEDWEALLTTVDSVAQTPDVFAECLSAAVASSSDEGARAIFHSHAELVGSLLIRYLESVCDKRDCGYSALLRALKCAVLLVDSTAMEAVSAILLEALDGYASSSVNITRGRFLIDAADVVVRFFLPKNEGKNREEEEEEENDAPANPALPLLSCIFISSADVAADPSFRSSAFAVWENARAALPSVVDAVARPFLDAVLGQEQGHQQQQRHTADTTEVMHTALGRHIRSLLAGRDAPFLAALEAEVAGCEGPLCQEYAPHLLYYGRWASAPVTSVDARARQLPPPPRDRTLQTYRLAFAAARELKAPLPQWLLCAAALLYPVAEVGCYAPLADLAGEARRVLAVADAASATALVESLVAKARAVREGGAAAMYALAAELVARNAAAKVLERSRVADAFNAFFLSSDVVALQYADGALAGFEALSAAVAVVGGELTASIATKPSVASTAKRLSEELVARDFFGLGAQQQQQVAANLSSVNSSTPVLCRTLSAVTAFVRLGAYGESDLATLAAEVAERLPALSGGGCSSTPTPQLVAALRLLVAITETSATAASVWDGAQRAFCSIAGMPLKQQHVAQYLQALAYAAELAEKASSGISSEGCGLCAAGVAGAVAAFPRSGVRAELVHAKCAAQALHSLYSALAASQASDKSAPAAAALAASATEHAAALLGRMTLSPAPRVQALAHRILCDGLGAAAEALGPLEDISEEALTEEDTDPSAHLPAWVSGVLVPALARGIVYPRHELGGNGEVLPDDKHAQYYDVSLALSGSYGNNSGNSSSSKLSRSSGSSSGSLGSSSGNGGNFVNSNANIVRSAVALDYGCMLAWSVALHVAAKLHPSRRPLYALAIRGTERLGTELLLLLHYCLPEDRSGERPVLPASPSSSSLLSSSPKRSSSSSSSLSSFSDDATTSASSAIIGECGEAAEVVGRPVLRRLAAELVLEMLRYFPTLVRLWYVVNSDHRAARAAEAYVRLVNPVLCECQLGRASGRAGVEYEKDDIVVRAAVVLPELYPLAPPTIESVGRAEGLDDALWRKWQMGLNSLLAAEEEEGCPEGLAKRAAERWTDSLDKHFDGIEPCPICYSVFASNGHLPTLKCRVCKHKFHSSCMFKWFSTSHKTTCPLCKSDFAIRGFN